MHFFKDLRFLHNALLQHQTRFNACPAPMGCDRTLVLRDRTSAGAYFLCVHTQPNTLGSSTICLLLEKAVHYNNFDFINHENPPGFL